MIQCKQTAGMLGGKVRLPTIRPVGPAAGQRRGASASSVEHSGGIVAAEGTL